MSTPAPTDAALALPARHLRLYGQFWNVVSLCILGGAIIGIVLAQDGALGWRELAAMALMAAQAGLYVRVIILTPWPTPPRWLALYFLGGLGLWLAASSLNYNLWWLGFMYFGQMFGLLPPRLTVPGTAAVVLLCLLQLSGWRLNELAPGAVIGFFFQWLGSNALYLFIWSISRTSRERGQLILELQAARRELELARQRDTELAALRERERLARDLHDSLGHALVVLSVQLEAVQRLYKVDPERAATQVDELKRLTRASTDDLRRSLAGLRAPGLGERSLAQTLQTLAVETGQRAGWQLECYLASDADQLSPALAETVWRVAQEALTNIEKHAAARRVQLRLETPPRAARLTVSDDGGGLPPNAEALPGHYGLRGMRERVEGLGGTLTVHSNGAGTTVEAQLPIL